MNGYSLKNMIKIKNKICLVTGGTGSLGQCLVERLIGEGAKEVRVYSRDEFKQSEMDRHIGNSRIKYWLGDICNLERLKDACEGVDIIFHTAAMKRMDSVSHNAAVVADVNITGTRNVIAAGKLCELIVFVSTDKAFQPSCVYGASKMIAESIVLASKNGVVWRFGNFIGSRGSVIQIFKEQRELGLSLTVTEPDATRFVIEIEDVCNCLLSNVMIGTINYPPNLKSMTILEIAQSIAPWSEYKIVGLREGEKLHESFNEDYTSAKKIICQKT